MCNAENMINFANNKNRLSWIYQKMLKEVIVPMNCKLKPQTSEVYKIHVKLCVQYIRRILIKETVKPYIPWKGDKKTKHQSPQ